MCFLEYWLVAEEIDKKREHCSQTSSDSEDMHILNNDSPVDKKRHQDQKNAKTVQPALKKQKTNEGKKIAKK